MKQFCLLIILMLLIGGCAPTVYIKMMVPAQKDIGSIKKLAVLDFDISGSVSLKSGPSYAPELTGAVVSQFFTAALVRNGYFTVLDRTAIDKLLSGQRSSLSGLIEPNEAVKIGAMLGVQGLVLGRCTYAVNDVVDLTEGTQKIISSRMAAQGTAQYDTIMAPTRYYTACRKIEVRVEYRIVDVATGKIMVAENSPFKNYSENSFGVIRCEESASDSIENSAIQHLPPWSTSITRKIQNAVENAVHRIAPQYVTEPRRIEKGSLPSMKTAVRYAQKSMWEDAKTQWEAALSDATGQGKKDYIAALANMALYYEIIGAFAKSEGLYQQCFDLSGKSKYLDAKAGIRQRIQDQARFVQQPGE